MRDTNKPTKEETDAGPLFGSDRGLSVGGSSGVNVRVGVAFPGDPRNPMTWSGTPAGLCAGLEASGVEVVPLDASPGAALDRLTMNMVSVLRLHQARERTLRDSVRLARAMARASPELSRLRTRALHRKLTAVGPLDGLVQIGAGYMARTDAPIVVFDDITVPQAVELGYPEWRALSQRAIRARIDLQRRVYERARACCVTSRWGAESVIRDYGIPPERVFVVGIGRNHEPGVARRDWTTPRFLFIGTHWHGKNGAAVLHAFDRLKREIEDAELDLVGDHPPVSREGVRGHGTLRLDDAGQRRRMEGLFQRATCFVLPSRYEAAAIAYVEAGGAGLPSIGTSVGGGPELIGDAGRIVDPSDVEGLFAAMRELSNPETAERLGNLARERASLFTWQAVAERVLRALALPEVRLDSFAEFL
jgi:glycosyltransferase involved in cell wall biosynthesis